MGDSKDEQDVKKVQELIANINVEQAESGTPTTIATPSEGD